MAGWQYSSRGYVLLPVMLALIVVAAVVLMLNHQLVGNLALVRNDGEGARAEYIAQAGMQHALWQLSQRGCGPFDELGGGVFDGGSYTVTSSMASAVATSATVQVDSDSWVRSDNPTDNKATDSSLHVRQEGSVVERALYRFDLSSIAAGSEIVSAVAHFYVVKEHSEGAVQVRRVTDEWSEVDVSWETVSNEMDEVIQASIPPQAESDVWVAVNLTAQVQAWVNGEQNFGVALHSDAEGVHAQYASREHVQRPYLEIIVGDSPGTTVTVTATGTTSNTTSRSISRTRVPLLQQPPGYRERRPDAAGGVDAWLAQSAPGHNHGVSTELHVRDRGATDDRRSLVRFDLSNIPHGATIIAADLQLYQHGTAVAGGDIAVHRITREWTEGSSAGAPGGGVTWNRGDWFSPWSSSGGDHDTVAVDVQPISAGNKAYYTWDLTSLLQRWIDGAVANHGVLLLPASSDAEAVFRSSDHDVDAERPKLSVYFSCPCGMACVAPRARSLRLAMVGDNGSFSPDPIDVQKAEIFESWGYDVDHFDDDSLWMLDAENYDIVYVSQTARSNDIGTQLSAETTGIVNEEGLLNDELGIGSGAVWPVGESIDIVDTDHYITRYFAAGDLSIYSGAMEGLALSGGITEGRSLAEWDSGAGLFAVDVGAALTSGDAAAGRRVSLPFGRTTDWSRVNSNGRLLVQRALLWASGGGEEIPVCGDHTPIRKREEFSTDGIESDSIKGITYLPAGIGFKGKTSPAGGAWLIVDSVDDKIYITDTDGSKIADNSVPGPSPTGIAYIEAGPYAGHVAVTDLNDGLYLVDAEGDEASNFTVPGVSNPVGVTYINGSESDAYDQALAVIDASGAVSIIDQSGSLLHVQDYSGDLNQPEDVAHIHGTDQLLIVDRGDDRVLKAGLDGGISPHYDIAAFGSDAAYAIAINGASCEHVIGDLGTDLVMTLTDQQRQPIAHWMMDEAGGAAAVDSVGGHDGKLINGVGWSTGQIGGAVDLDGVDDQIVVEHQNTLSLNSGFSLSAWINSDVVPAAGRRPILGKGDGSAVNYWFGLTGDVLMFHYTLGGSPISFNTSSQQLSAGAWHHVAAVFDEDNSALKIYVDGWPVYTAVMNKPAEPNASDLYIGGFGSSSGNWLGKLDDVRVYDEALSDNEIAALYTAASGTPPTAPPVPPVCPGTFVDQFNVRVFDASDGSIDWSGAPWLEVGESDGPAAGDVRITANVDNYQLRIRDNDNGGEGVARVVNLVGADTAELRYRFRRVGLDSSNDYVRVEMSSTGSAPWSVLAQHAGPDNDGGYQNAVHDISGHISPQTTLRFMSSPTMGGTDTVWFDDVSVRCEVGSP